MMSGRHQMVSDVSDGVRKVSDGVTKVSDGVRQNCIQLFMYMNNWDEGVAPKICPAYLVLANIQYKPEPLPQTSTFYCILALARAAPHTWGNLCPKYVEPIPQTTTFYCMLASSRSDST